MPRVLVAEDSTTLRAFLISMLESDPEITVVGQAANGVEAVELAAQLRPDIITMDVHMPLLDGFEATKEIMARTPTPIIIVSSSTSNRDVELSLNAMRAGALLVVEKPDRPESNHFTGRRERLLAMVKAMANVMVVRRWAPDRAGQATPLPPIRTRAQRTTRLVAIAASTGGPAALHRVLTQLPSTFPVPILIVQHIASGFGAGLATWLDSACSLHVKVATHGEPLRPRTVYLAPDNQHLGVGADGCVLVNDAPPVQGFRPSATFLFESAAQRYGAATAAVILTGMGEDGVAGLHAVHAAGGMVIAQDEASSIVFGMPRQAIEAGVVDAILPIADVATRLVHLTAGGDDVRPHPDR